jgi:hypothetical protein
MFVFHYYCHGDKKRIGHNPIRFQSVLNPLSFSPFVQQRGDYVGGHLSALLRQSPQLVGIGGKNANARGRALRPVPPT